MKAGVIYGARSKIIRRIVVVGDGETLDGHVGDGEALACCSVRMDGGFPVLDDAIEAVRSATGVTPPSGRCLVIEGGRVTAVINADPHIDRIDGVTLLATEVGDVGWSWTQDGGLVPPLVGPAASSLVVPDMIEVFE